MITNLLPAIGGLGLFLFGVMTLTEGLRGLAGGALRRILTRFTKDPVTGAATGAIVTGIIQSSSATTVAAVSFVGAGLMTFPQALGIIFGANIGTTMTGWIVAIVGFKLNLGEALLPGIFLGVVLRMFGKGRLQHAGSALAGFSMLFVGVAMLQQGLESLESVIRPESFPPDTIFGRLELVLFGALLTIVLQSSSAGVATALAAIGADLITFNRAAAMIIGMDIGTTFTAALATIGGSTAMRRTGYAHVIYNLLTGVMAFILLTPYTALVSRWLELETVGDAQIAAVAFHTAFNTLGVLLVVGFTQPFARLIIRLVPEQGPQLLRRLDDRLLADADAAVDAEAATIDDIRGAVFSLLAEQLDPGEGVRGLRTRHRAVREALDATRTFSEHVLTTPRAAAVHERHQSVLHAIDHLDRLLDRLGQDERIRFLRTSEPLRGYGLRLAGLLSVKDEAKLMTDQIDALRKELRSHRRAYRETTIAAAAGGTIDPQSVPLMLDSVRWLHRVAYHAWRISYHVQRARQEVPAPRAPDEPVTEAQED